MDSRCYPNYDYRQRRRPQDQRHLGHWCLVGCLVGGHTRWNRFDDHWLIFFETEAKRAQSVDASCSSCWGQRLVLGGGGALVEEGGVPTLRH